MGPGCGGKGAAGVAYLAQWLGADLVATPDGKGHVDPTHPRFAGVCGFGGHVSAAAAIAGADLVVAFGVSFGEFASGGWAPGVADGRLVHVDGSDFRLLRSIHAALHVRGDVEAVFAELAKAVRRSGPPHPKPGFLLKADSPRVEFEEPDKARSDATPIKPQRLMRDLGRLCPAGTLFLADAGNSFSWSAHYLSPRPGKAAGRFGSFAATYEFAPMGWPIGAAVGASVADPSRPVVCLTGDGSWLMNGQEVTTAVAERLPVLFVILNDAALGMVMHGQRLGGAERIGFALPEVDFAAMAEAVGARGHVVRSPGGLGALDFAEIFARPLPTVLDVRVDPQEVPPMKLRTKTLAGA